MPRNTVFPDPAEEAEKMIAADRRWAETPQTMTNQPTAAMKRRGLKAPPAMDVDDQGRTPKDNTATALRAATRAGVIAAMTGRPALAHLLAPQLIRKAQEIEDSIGPPRPLAAGYMQARSPAPTASERGLKELRARPAPRPDQVFKAAAAQGVNKAIAKSKIKPIPNAAPPARPVYPPAKGGIQAAPDEPIGMHEDGRAIYAVEPAPKKAAPKKGRTIIAIPEGAVGATERGEAVTRGGTNLGYLRNRENPNVRTLERNKMDVAVGERNAYDKYDVQVLQKRFGEHLKAMQDNRDPDGMPTDQFPEGHFDGMSPAARKEIEAGVERLRELERGVPI